MPIYLFWGEDEFAIAKAVDRLRQNFLDPDWLQFNFHKLDEVNAAPVGSRREKVGSDVVDATVEALNQAMTPAFGLGGRLIWLANTSLTQQCSEALLTQLERTLPAVPETSHLVLTTSKKPDKRLKSTKLLHKHAQIQEFSLIPPWKTEAIEKNVQQVSQEVGVKLTPDAIQLLAESIGNNPRQLWNELEKLRLYQKDDQTLDSEAVAALVNANTQNSLQLAAAIRDGNQDRALQLVTELINRNEPALRIVATLVGRFRTWTVVRLMIEKGENDSQIAKVAEVGNPKRIYFLRKEVSSLSSRQCLAAFPILLELELGLKRGAEPLAMLQTKAIELCQLFNSVSGKTPCWSQLIN